MRQTIGEYGTTVLELLQLSGISLPKPFYPYLARSVWRNPVTVCSRGIGILSIRGNFLDTSKMAPYYSVLSPEMSSYC